MFDIKPYLFLGIYAGNPLSTGLPQTWSLAIEVQLYVLLPLIVLTIGWIVRRVRRRVARHPPSPRWACLPR